MLKQRGLMSILSVFCMALIGCGGGDGAGAAKPAVQPAGQPAVPATIGGRSSSAYTNAPVPAGYTPPPAIEAAKPEYTVTAEELAKEFTADPEAAGKKHGNKVARIDGKVVKVWRSESGVKVLNLVGEGAMHLECGIMSDSFTAADALKEGDAVSVVGKIYGKLDKIISVDSCVIVK